MSTITEQDIKALTPQHRIVWHQPPGQPVEMGLYVDEVGALTTDSGTTVRRGDGSVPLHALGIVRIIPPAFTPRRGLVIGHPNERYRRLVHTGADISPWLGYAPEFGDHSDWYTNDGARNLIENHGWEVVDDLAAPGEVTDAEVKAAARALADYYGAGSAGWSAWASEARAALEAAREMSDAREALVDLIDGAIPDDIPGYRQRYTDRAADAILAAGWTPPGERVQCDHERAAREMARVMPLSVADTLRMIEAMVKLGPPTVKPSVEDVAAAIETETAAYDPVTSPERGEPESLLAADGSDMSLTAARAVLALLPGRTEAEVKAEAWDEWHSCEYPREEDHARFCINPYRKEADRG